MKTYACAACGTNRFPSFVPSGTSMKLVVQCANPDCNKTDGSLGPADFSQGLAAVADESVEQKAGWSGKRAIVVDLTAAAAPMPKPAPHVPQTTHANGGLMPPAPPIATYAAAPGDVLSWIEDRAMWLAAEEARIAGAIAELESKRAGVRGEKKQLDKMLKSARRCSPRAAEPEPAQRELRVN